MLWNRRRALLDRAQPDEQKNDGEQGQDPEDDQERSPHGQDERERCGSSGKSEAQGEEPEDCRGDRHADPDTERSNLALDLEQRELELETRQRARVLGDLLGRRPYAVLSLLGGHGLSSRAPSRERYRQRMPRR